MNYQTVYDGIKILEMNKDSIISTFNIYLKTELKKDVGNKDKLLYDKFQTFYKGCMNDLKDIKDKEIIIKNTFTLLNILSHIATKLTLEEENLNIICKLLGNLKKIQFKLQKETNTSSPTTTPSTEMASSSISSEKTVKLTKFKNQEIKNIEVNPNNSINKDNKNNLYKSIKKLNERKESK